MLFYLTRQVNGVHRLLEEASTVASVVKEIRQSREFESRGEEAVVTLLRTADAVRLRIAAIVETSEITAQQYNVLRILRGAGDGGLATLEIAARMLERCPGVTRLVDRLVAAGLVVRSRGLNDRRQRLCRITPKGRSLVTALDGPVRSAAEQCTEALGATGQRNLVRLLDQMRAAASRPTKTRPSGALALEPKEINR
jgi:DNA-binding MarR family transcriptional regulator